MPKSKIAKTEKDNTDEKQEPKKRVVSPVKIPKRKIKENKETIDLNKQEAEAAEKPEEKSGKYIRATGRRKTAVAQVRLFTRGEKLFLVNGKPCENYFQTQEQRLIAVDSLKTMNCLERFGINSIVRGGGLTAQAEAIRHGIARALISFNPDFRKRLKKAGFLTRDARKRERKKFGLKRARRAPQWAKR